MKLDAESLGRLTILNTVLIGVNTLILGALLMRPAGDGDGDDGPRFDPDALREASAPTDDAGSASVPLPGGSTDKPAPLSDDPFENFILSTVKPLASAAKDHGKEALLPSDEEQQACIASGEVESQPCAAVLAQLKEGYEQYGMPFPAPPDMSKAPPIVEAGPDGGAPGGAGSTASAGGESEVVRVYLDTLETRLRSAVEAAGDDPDAVLPDPALVEAAVASGDPRSEASGVVLDHLREQFEAYGLRFAEPYVAGGSGTTAPALGGAPAETAPSADDAQRELLQSYLDHMIQRLERAATDQGKDPALLKPRAEAVAAAVGSGAVDSPETQAVLATLRTSYKNLDLAFTEPPM